MQNIKYLLPIIFLATASLLVMLASAETVTTTTYNLTILDGQGGGAAATSSYNLTIGQTGSFVSTTSYNLTIGFVYAGTAVDSTPPTTNTQAQSANSVSQFGTLNLSANVADNIGLSSAFLSTNETGTWVNWSGKYGSPINLYSTGGGHASFIWTNYSLEGGANIGWRIYVNDTSNNFAQTGQLNFLLLKTISISIANDPVRMSILAPSQYNSTDTSAGYNPLPFVINNTGNFAANITIEAGNLFQVVANPNIYFQFRSVVNETNSVRNTVLELISSFLNIPATATMVANMTNFTDDNDEIRVHINVTVPRGEPPANRTSTVTLTAAAAY